MAHFASYNTTQPVNPQTVLKANQEIKLETLRADQSEYILGSVYADQAGKIFIEQSFDGEEHFDISAEYEVKAKEAVGFKEMVIAPLFRVRYINGTTEQKEFRLFVRASTYHR
jgi:hypothetical protein